MIMNSKLVILLALSTLYSIPSLAQMDQAEMQMQGGTAPTDARDPHAYSDGYTLTEGPYALPGPRTLKLADEHSFWSILGDRLEYNEGSEAAVFDLQGWYGTTYNRFAIKTEGDYADGALEESSTDLLWDRAMNAYFNTQLGIRLDQSHEGKNRQWLAAGVQGLAPYWFEIDLTAYMSDNGRTSLTAEAEYELMITQRLILQPRAELSFYGKDDPENGIGKGLSDVSLGLRLRYEFSRQFAPYIGVEWSASYGNTAEFLQEEGLDTSDTEIVAGVRFWY